eukprot:scaffold25838_cov63-Cyclotella_meneghiniana.AAC.2
MQLQLFVENRPQTKIDGKGMGAFSTTTIIKGSTLGEYHGEVLTRRQVEARYWGTRKETKHDRKWRKSRTARNQGLSGDYLFDVGNDLYIDGEDADVSSWCRFANHAEELDDDSADSIACNAEVLRRLGWDQDGKAELRLFLVAIRDIEPGTEICYDYGGEYW